MTTNGQAERGERTTIVQPPQAGRPSTVPPQGPTTVLRAPGSGDPLQPPTTVLAATPPPRPPAGQIVSQDRPYERPAGARHPGKRTSTSSYVRTLAPLVGMSIVVVVLIAGITAWISSSQDRTAAPPAPRPAAVPSVTATAPPSAIVPSKAKTTPKATPKAVAPTKVVPKTTVPKAATSPTSAAAQPKPSVAAEPSGGAVPSGSAEDGRATCRPSILGCN